MKDRKNILIRKRHLIPLFLIYALLFSIPAQGQSDRRLEKLYHNTDGSLIVKKAEEVLNVSYLYNGMKPENGFDCSGLICWSYGQFGYILPHGSSLLAKIGTKVSLDEAKAGDLVCFGQKTNDHASVFHVGMIHSRNEDEILMIHSGTSNGVSIVPLTSGYWSKEDYLIVRIID